MPIIGEVRIFAFGQDSKKYEELVNKGWLPCDGRSFKTSDRKYKKLYKAIGDTWGAEHPEYEFSLPNFSGTFLRSSTLKGANVKSYDPDASERKPPRPDLEVKGNNGAKVGSIQESQNMAHNHEVNAKKAGGTALNKLPVTASAGGPADEAILTLNTGGNESRPVNHYVLYMIYAGAQSVLPLPDSDD